MTNLNLSKLRIKFVGWGMAGVFALQLGVAGTYLAQPYALES